MKLALVLGTSAAALEEFQRARAFARTNALELRVIAVNDAIKDCPVKPHAFCTVISGQVAAGRFLDGVNADGVLMFARRPSPELPAACVKPKWQGTSGLYAVQIALEELGAEGVILAGVPIDAGHGARSPHSLMGEPARVERYRAEWIKALPAIKHRVRSMSGWTRDLLGAPSPDWLTQLTEQADHRLAA